MRKFILLLTAVLLWGCNLNTIPTDQQRLQLEVLGEVQHLEREVKSLEEVIVAQQNSLNDAKVELAFFNMELAEKRAELAELLEEETN